MECIEYKKMTDVYRESDIGKEEYLVENIPMKLVSCLDITGECGLMDPALGFYRIKYRRKDRLYFGLYARRMLESGFVKVQFWGFMRDFDVKHVVRFIEAFSRMEQKYGLEEKVEAESA